MEYHIPEISPLPMRTEWSSGNPTLLEVLQVNSKLLKEENTYKHIVVGRKTESNDILLQARTEPVIYEDTDHWKIFARRNDAHDELVVVMEGKVYLFKLPQNQPTLKEAVYSAMRGEMTGEPTELPKLRVGDVVDVAFGYSIRMESKIAPTVLVPLLWPPHRTSELFGDQILASTGTMYQDKFALILKDGKLMNETPGTKTYEFKSGMRTRRTWFDIDKESPVHDLKTNKLNVILFQYLSWAISQKHYAYGVIESPLKFIENDNFPSMQKHVQDLISSGCRQIGFSVRVPAHIFACIFVVEGNILQFLDTTGHHITDERIVKTKTKTEELFQRRVEKIEQLFPTSFNLQICENSPDEYPDIAGRAYGGLCSYWTFFFLWQRLVRNVSLHTLRERIINEWEKDPHCPIDILQTFYAKFESQARLLASGNLRLMDEIGRVSHTEPCKRMYSSDRLKVSKKKRHQQAKKQAQVMRIRKYLERNPDIEKHERDRLIRELSELKG